jgi:hypothetical protein
LPLSAACYNWQRRGQKKDERDTGQNLEEIQELSDDEQERLRKLLAEKARASETPKSIEELAAEQGVGPMDFEELRALGEFWPEDESIDDFLEFVGAHAVRPDFDPSELYHPERE